MGDRPRGVVATSFPHPAGNGLMRRMRSFFSRPPAAPETRSTWDAYTHVPERPSLVLVQPPGDARRHPTTHTHVTTPDVVAAFANGARRAILEARGVEGYHVDDDVFVDGADVSIRVRVTDVARINGATLVSCAKLTTPDIVMLLRKNIDQINARAARMGTCAYCTTWTGDMRAYMQRELAALTGAGASRDGSFAADAALAAIERLIVRAASCITHEGRPAAAAVRPC